MAAISFYLGAKRVTSKKNGQTYLFVSVLRLNRYGDWESIAYDCDCTETFEKIKSECEPGFPVVITRDSDDYLVSCTPVDDFEPLNLPAAPRRE